MKMAQRCFWGMHWVENENVFFLGSNLCDSEQSGRGMCRGYNQAGTRICVSDWSWDN